MNRVEETWMDLAPGGVFTPRTEVRFTEQVTRLFGDLVCRCGNAPAEDGFYPCLDDGTIVEPTIKGPWKGKLYACARCGRIINRETLDVTGQRDPRYIIDEAADAGGWDD